MIRRFNRYELKYVLPSWKCDAIIADLAEMTTPDVSRIPEPGLRSPSDGVTVFGR